MQPVESIELGWITTPGGISKRDIHSILGNVDITKNGAGYFNGIMKKGKKGFHEYFWNLLHEQANSQ